MSKEIIQLELFCQPECPGDYQTHLTASNWGQEGLVAYP